MTGTRLRMRGLGLRTWRRQVRSETVALVTIATATLLTVGSASIAPRVLEHAAEADLRDAVAAAAPEQRNLSFELTSRVGTGPLDDSFRYVDLRGEQLLESDVPDSVERIIREQRWLFDSPEFQVSSFPAQVGGPFPTTFKFRYQEGVADQLSLVSGAMPAAADPVFLLEGSECPDRAVPPDEFERSPEQDCFVVELPVFEAAVTRQTAADMMLAVGDQVTLTPSLSDIKWRTAPTVALRNRIVLRISGIVELTDPSLEYWYADSALHRPRITENPDFRLVAAVGLIAPDRYRRLLGAIPGVNSEYTWRCFVDPEQVTNADPEQLARDLDKIGPVGVHTVTLLPDVLVDHVLQRRLTAQLLASSTAGLLVVAVATIGALALLSALRQSRSTSLVGDRGGSRLQLAGNAFRTAALVALPPSLVGWLVAWRLFPDTSSSTSVSIALALSSAVIVAVVAMAVPGRRDHQPGRSRRRIVAEGVLFVGAVGAVLSLRRRSLFTADGDVRDVDLLLAITPALVALVAGTVAIRLVGPTSGAIAAVAARRRGLATFVGFRRLVVQPVAMRFPLVVMTVAVAVAALSSVLATSVSEGQRLASWQAVGGDYRIETSNPDVPLPPSLDRAGLDPQRSPVFGAIVRNARLRGPERGGIADLVAVDAAEYRAVLERAGIDSGLDALVEALDRPGAGQAGPSGPIPAVAIGSWPTPAPVVTGDLITIDLGAFSPTVVVVTTTTRFPGVLAGRSALVVERSELTRLTDDRTTQATFVLVSGDAGDADAIASATEREGISTHVTSRHDRLETISGDPLSTWTERTLRAVALLSVLFVIVAAVSAAAITHVRLQRDLGLLSVLGLRARQASLVVAIEHVPTVLLSIVVGGVSGVVIAHLLEPVLGLDAFAGGGTTVGITVDVVDFLAAVGVVFAVMVTGLAASTAVLRRRPDARMLRRGDQ